jgi:ATP-dependent protease Clp ATPase subunit
MSAGLQSLQAFNAQQLDDEVEIEKAIIMVGQTGTGKTLVAKIHR